MNGQITGVRGTVGHMVTRRAGDWNVEQVRERTGGGDLLVRATDTQEDGSGGFEGWGCVYGVTDSYGTTFMPGCFTEGGLDEAAYAFLAMHSPTSPIGTFVAEDREEGLWIAGEYDPTPDAQAWRARALSGSAPELSVGFVWLADGGEDAESDITSARLVETSQITLRMGAVPGAALQGVRSEDLTAADKMARARAHALLELRLLEV